MNYYWLLIIYIYFKSVIYRSFISFYFLNTLCLIASPKSLAKTSFFSELVGYSAIEVPQVTPLHLFDFPVATLQSVRLGNDSPLNVPVCITNVHYCVLLSLVDRPNESLPKEGLLIWRVCFKLICKFLSRSLSFLHDQVGVLFVHLVSFALLSREHVGGVLLSDLRKMAPRVRISSQGTFVLVRTWRHNICFISLFRLQYPLSKRVHEAESFGGTWLDQN